MTRGGRANCAPGDKGSETRDGKAERYNVMNLFMQYNLAHSDYNSAKFNWIVYSRRSRHDQSKREGPAPAPAPARSFLTSLLFHPSLCPLVAEKTKEVSSSFLGSQGRLLSPARCRDRRVTRLLSTRAHTFRRFCACVYFLRACHRFRARARVLIRLDWLER